jgi:hypothetical protein
MSLLAATIADAQRPLPDRGGTFLVQRAAVEEPEPEMIQAGDPVALTVYRLQKDGANAIAPAAPARGSATTSRDGPSTGIKHAYDVGDPGVANRHVERRAFPFVGERKESNVRESRFASTEARVSEVQSLPIPSPTGVDTLSAQAASIASTSDVDSQSETSGPTEHRYERRRVARSAPSEDPNDAQAPTAAVREVAPAERLAEPATSGDIAADVAAAIAAAAPVLAHAAAESAPDAAYAARVASAVAPRAQYAAPPRVVAPAATDSAAPRVHIGRIDVTVLADAPVPGAGARGGADSSDRHFLSRHYLRRP